MQKYGEVGISTILLRNHFVLVLSKFGKSAVPEEHSLSLFFHMFSFPVEMPNYIFSIKQD